MKRLEKDQAVELRKNGYSLKHIAQLLHVSKSSVSSWVKGVHLSPTQLQLLAGKGFSSDLIEKRRIKRLENESVKREKIIASAEKDITNITLKDLHLIGTLLYWAEGGKTRRGMVRFSNSNPEMIRTMMCFFWKICKVEEKKFKGHIHTHSHINIANTEQYWQEITGVPREQFFKTYAKPSKSSKNMKDNLPFGTFDIYICDTVLFLKIMGWIRKIAHLTRNFS